MTSDYHTPIPTGADLDAAEINSPLGQLDAALAEITSSAWTYDDGLLCFGAAVELTISSGAITVTGIYYRIDTEGDARRDELETINGGSEGDLLIIRAENAARPVIVKHNTGNIFLYGQVDLVLDDVNDHLMLIYDGSKWNNFNESVYVISLYGYFAGGLIAGPVVTADRLVFATGVTSANAPSNLSQARYFLAGLSDKAIYGYFAGGGQGGPGGGLQVTADRLVFATGVTAANAPSNLSQAKEKLAGLSDGASYGYFAGGYAGSIVATADRLVFSTGVTAANAPSDLSQARQGLAGLSDGASYGYFAGGITTGGVVATADRLVFSTGVTAANAPSDLSQARQVLAGLSDGAIYGYFAGGFTSSNVATADRLVFSTGVTAANATSDLSQARSGLAGLSDGLFFGYFAGGTTGGVVVTADRLVFSTGVTAANASSDLSQARQGLAGLSDKAI